MEMLGKIATLGVIFFLSWLFTETGDEFYDVFLIALLGTIYLNQKDDS